MSVQHASIPEVYLHESKGVSTAAAGQVYVTDGVGSGSWKNKSRYGELYIDAGVTTQTLSAASAYARLDPGTEWAAGVSSGVTLNATDGTFTIVETGTYNISFWVVFLTAALAAGTRYFFRYAVNGTPIARTISISKITAGADYLDTGATGLADLTAGDVLSIYVAGDGTSSNTLITPVEAGFILHKV
jgi:hypothetical protein